MPERQETTVEPSVLPLRNTFDAAEIASGLNHPATITPL